MIASTIDSYLPLYGALLQRLRLSAPLIHILTKAGITSVGDCVDFFVLDRINAHPADPAVYINDLMAQSRKGTLAPLPVLMYRDVKPQMEAHGYWSVVEDIVLTRGVEPHRRMRTLVIRSQTNYKSLFRVPIERLELTETAQTLAKRFSISSVGDCVLAFIKEFRDYPQGFDAHEMLRNISQRTGYIPFFMILWGEIQQKMWTHGYGPYITGASEQSPASEPRPSHPYTSVFDIPLTSLELSRGILTALTVYGIRSVGDCAAFYGRDALTPIRHSLSPLRTLMYGDIRACLIQHGSWPLLLNADVWPVMDRLILPHAMIVQWEGREQDLYALPTEELNISKPSEHTVWRYGFKTIGDCVLFYYHAAPDGSPGAPQLLRVMYGEVEQSMRACGFWPFVEEGLAALG